MDASLAPYRAENPSHMRPALVLQSHYSLLWRLKYRTLGRSGTSTATKRHLNGIALQIRSLGHGFSGTRTLLKMKSVRDPAAMHTPCQSGIEQLSQWTRTVNDQVIVFERDPESNPVPNRHSLLVCRYLKAITVDEQDIHSYLRQPHGFPSIHNVFSNGQCIVCTSKTH